MKKFVFFPTAAVAILTTLLLSCTLEKALKTSVTGVTLNRSFVTLAPGGTLNLTASVQPEGASKQSVIWISDNPNIATVNNGLITARTLGAATITVITNDGEKEATCAVTVTEAVPLTATMQPSELKNTDISIEGIGPVVVDWGDGAATEKLLTKGTAEHFIHNYSRPSARTAFITIIGENIMVIHCNDIPALSLSITPNNTLQQLNCSGNQLSTLDVSGCSALTTLWCGNNQLSTLNVTGCDMLTILWCGNNRLSNVDLSGCSAMEVLYCTNNQITNLNIADCRVLAGIYCSNNLLSSLDISGFSAFEGLYCANNQLISLKVRGVVSLKGLTCKNNLLTSLDLSGTSVAGLNCESNELQTSALNALFETLPSTDGTLYINGNPGSDYCNKDVATLKGWKFR